MMNEDGGFESRNRNANLGLNRAMRYAFFGLLAVLGSSAFPFVGAADDAVASALEVTISRNAIHAREWLEQKDFKSLAQSASGLTVLAEMLVARSDDRQWQATTEKVVAAAHEVQAAAGAADLAKCTATLDALDKTVTAIKEIRPSGKAAPIAKPPGIRPLMLLMDTTLADAKVSLITGQVETAKNESRVVAELGKLVSNSRTTPEWLSLAGDFCAAANTAANSTESDPKAVRQLIRGVAERCEACHEKSRTR
jgi:cytochrome c556